MPTTVPKRPGPSRGRRGRSIRGRGVTQGGEESAAAGTNDERPGTSRDVPRRARGRRGRGPAVLCHEDLVRVQQLHQDRIAAEQVKQYNIIILLLLLLSLD